MPAPTRCITASTIWARPCSRRACRRSCCSPAWAGPAYHWGSPLIVALIAIAAVALFCFPVIEARAAEPILPLNLFRNRTFVVTSAVGFIIGLALFGAVTYLPLYLQVVKGHSPTSSGLLLTPMMAGLLVTSILSGNLIARFGRYRMFPIAGTALATVGLFLLSRLGVTTSTLAAALYMLVLGLGLGMVMQVLVLAVQNAVDYRYLGVATSGSTLFRQVGGSIGVSAFGAIFSSRLAGELAKRIPPGVHIPAQANPAVVKHLPAAVHGAYIEAFSAALQPVFVTAAAVALFSFLLSWLLRELPLRQTAAAEGVGESFAAPRHGSSERELERILSSLSSARSASGSTTRWSSAPESRSPRPRGGCSTGSASGRRPPRRRWPRSCTSRPSAYRRPLDGLTRRAYVTTEPGLELTADRAGRARAADQRRPRRALPPARRVGARAGRGAPARAAAARRRARGRDAGAVARYAGTATGGASATPASHG